MSVLCHVCGGHLEVTESCPRCAAPDAPRAVDAAELEQHRKWEQQQRRERWWGLALALISAAIWLAWGWWPG